MRHRPKKGEIPCDEVIVLEYQKNGMTMKGTAEVLGISVGYVHKVLHRTNAYIKPNTYAQLLTKESREKSGYARRGRKFTEEHRRNIAKAKTLHGPGHRKPREDGYISVYYPEHPSATKDGYVMEHRLLMEKKIGRLLEKDEVVHHKNHNRKDNRLDNLQLMTFKEHAALHMRERQANRRER